MNKNKKHEVGQFLQDFKEKLKVFDVVFLNREKNLQTLTTLEIAPVQRRQWLEALQVTDYVDGPKPDKAYDGADMWIFGRTIKNCEIYIKITKGKPGKNVLCISFHIAEHTLKYPFKN